MYRRVHLVHCVSRGVRRLTIVAKYAIFGKNAYVLLHFGFILVFTKIKNIFKKTTRYALHTVRGIFEEGYTGGRCPLLFSHGFSNIPPRLINSETIRTEIDRRGK